MKLPLILPALVLPVLLTPVLYAQGTPLTDFSGNVSSLTISLTINETIGGNRLTDDQVASLALRGTTVPSLITFDTTYGSAETAASAIRNPFGWDITKGNNYVELVSSSTNASGNLVVRASGSHKINKARYTNATLLADLVAADLIPATRGYRLVAVRFTTDIERVYDNRTVVNSGLYFFADNGTDDPVFLGAENDVYDYEQVIDFESFETAESGKYIDTFTGRTEEEGGGFAYDVVSDSYSGLSLAEVSIYRRPSSPLAYYEMRVGGIFRWKETYNARQDVYARAAITGKGLSGPANTYVPVDTNDDDVTDSYAPSGLNEGVVNGSVVMATARQQADLQRYLDQLPGVLTN